VHELQLEEGFEFVYLIDDWWDGPKSGMADFKGIPHYFERIFDEKKDDWSENYRIRKITEEEQSLLIERTQLFQEWIEESKMNNKPHPLEEHLRYKVINELLKEIRCDFYQDIFFGSFIPIKSDKNNDQKLSPYTQYQVKWIRL
jgi:hypothetical protein